MDYLTFLSNISQIVTGVLAVGGAAYYVFGLETRRRKLERYLKSEREGTKNYQHSTLHLMAKLGMTEEELFRASFRSKRIRRVLKWDKSGVASHILFEYVLPN